MVAAAAGFPPTDGVGSHVVPQVLLRLLARWLEQRCSAVAALDRSDVLAMHRTARKRQLRRRAGRYQMCRRRVELSQQWAGIFAIRRTVERASD